MQNPSSTISSIFWISLLIVGSILACQNNATETGENLSAEPESSPPIPAKDLQSKNALYAWVDNLNIRGVPNTKGKTVATVQTSDLLQFTGEKSPKTETIVLRGVAYDEPWLKIKMVDGQEGWVFGGAVKREDEQKGNAPITALAFEFPHFGKFDLKNWRKKVSQNGEGGDAMWTTTTYTRGNQILEITKTDVGEYGYSQTYTLMDESRKVLRKRDLSFTADVDLRELSETVEDFASTPPKRYQRTQKLEQHVMRLNALPLMASGQWTEGPIE